MILYCCCPRILSFGFEDWDNMAKLHNLNLHNPLHIKIKLSYIFREILNSNILLLRIWLENPYILVNIPSLLGSCTVIKEIFPGYFCNPLIIQEKFLLRRCNGIFRTFMQLRHKRMSYRNEKADVVVACHCPSPPHSLNERLCIHWPAALSVVCLSWLGRIWNFGEGGLLCTKQASKRSTFCTATDRSTEPTALAGLLCTQRTTFTKISIFSQHFLSRYYFSLVSTV